MFDVPLTEEYRRASSRAIKRRPALSGGTVRGRVVMLVGYFSGSTGRGGAEMPDVHDPPDRVNGPTRPAQPASPARPASPVDRPSLLPRPNLPVLD